MKKFIGSYYTPSAVSQILTNWAIQKSNDYILEPSFGGCCFLEASFQRLRILGAKNPVQYLFGCDVDTIAFNHLKQKLGPIEISQKFLKRDFLSVKPCDFSNFEFNVVIGNPPYVSNHNMSKEQKQQAIKIKNSDYYDLPGNSSLWAYFIAHSLNFLAVGGRFAWILPGSFFHADYAVKIRDCLSNTFRRVITILVNERLFLSEGTEEHSLILLAEGKELGPTYHGLEICEAQNMSDLEVMINDWDKGKFLGRKLDSRPVLALMHEVDQKSFLALSKDKDCLQLGDVCDIHIGLVTGANDFFVINEELARESSLDSRWIKPILAKFIDAPGIAMVKSDYNDARNLNKRCLLIDTSDLSEKNSPIRKYLSTFPRDKRKNNCTFKKRALWHAVDDECIPDAFLSYMNHYGPRIVLNTIKINCTNTIHRLFFKYRLSHSSQILMAISLLSSFSQLSAEVEGRSYGSGILKLEPKEAKKILVLLPSENDEKEINKVFRNINSLLRTGMLNQAREEADNLILRHYSERDGMDYKRIFNKALQDARERRLSPVKGKH